MNTPAPRPARINPDSRPVLYLVVTVTAVLAAVSFTVSFAGLVAVAAWAAIPGWLGWALPVFIDGAIIVYTMSMLVFRARGESTVFAWTVLLAFAAVSVAANAAHAYGEGDPADWRTWVGAGLAGLAPAGVAVATHTIARLTVAPPESAQAEAAPVVAAAVEVAAPEPLPAEDVPAATAPDATPAPPDRSHEPLPRVEPSTEATPQQALAMRAGGMSQRAIADALGVSKTTISRWLREHAAQEESQRLRAVG